MDAGALDLGEAMEDEREGRAVGVDPPRPTPLPTDLQDLVAGAHGTLVLWSQVDRLEEGRAHSTYAEIVADAQKELARIFRDYIDGGVEISLNGTALLPHDPLFVMPNTFADHELTNASGGDASRDVRHFPATVFADEAFEVDGSKVRVRITLYPPEVTRKRGLGGDTLAKKLRIPDNTSAVSFMRLRREIAYTTVPRAFPNGVKAFDRFIGIEVAFDPDLDEYFGVRNVKRGVEPHGELRRKLREKLETYVPGARKAVRDRWGIEENEGREHAGEHAAILAKVKDASSAMPRGMAPAVSEEEANEALLELAHDAGHRGEDEANAYVARVRDLPFVVEPVNFPGKQFIEVRHMSHQVLIRLNTRHRFYREIWAPLAEVARGDERDAGEAAVLTAKRAVEGLTLMVIAYAKAQKMEAPVDKFEDLTAFWGQFLDTLLNRVRDV